MIRRRAHHQRVVALLRDFPVVALVGARQVGKTTLARQVSQQLGGGERFDLEDPADLARLDDPMLALADLRGLVVLDEIQRRPELFPALRVLADRPRMPARFLVLGSASPELLRQSSETLAGRIAVHHLGGLDLGEVGAAAIDPLWLRGGFPRSYLARSHAASFAWRAEFIATFLERDLPQLGMPITPTAMRRFWTMLAHGHGQLLNTSELGRSFGVADTTVRRYLDLLTSAFVVRQLQPWSANLKKRQVRSPKVYIADSGLLHALLDLPDRRSLERHPKIGASWEGFLLEQVVRRLDVRPSQCHFWATHGGAEIDLFVERRRPRRRPERLGFEFKRTTAPTVTRSMRHALEDLQLTELVIVHAGSETFPLGRRVRAVAAARLLEDLE